MLSSRSRVSEVTVCAFELLKSFSSPTEMAMNLALVITSSPGQIHQVVEPVTVDADRFGDLVLSRWPASAAGHGDSGVARLLSRRRRRVPQASCPATADSGQHHGSIAATRTQVVGLSLRSSARCGPESAGCDRVAVREGAIASTRISATPSTSARLRSSVRVGLGCQEHGKVVSDSISSSRSTGGLVE